MSQANLGYLYYKDYFRQLEFKADLILLETSGKNQALFNQKLPIDSEYHYDTLLKPLHTNFSLFTTYPGLLIGSGYNHEIGGIDDELKLGFFFDHTTGIPVIMGSSVKGLLRSVFPNLEKDESLKKLKTQWLEVLIRHIEEEKFFENTYQPDSEKGSLKDIDICQIENEIFEGKDSQGDYLSLYKRDIFHDAIIISKDRKFLDSDFITHHEHPLKNPNPIQFLKILPNIKFQFNFDLKEGLLTVEQKLRLFQKILLTIGIGAKTNVGYGQFSINEIIPIKESTPKQQYQDRKKKETPSFSNKNTKFEAKSKFELMSESNQKKYVLEQKTIKESDDWLDISSLALGSIIKATVLSCKDGNSRLWLHVKGNSEELSCQGNLPINQVINIKIVTTEGSPKKGNYKITKVIPIKNG